MTLCDLSIFDEIRAAIVPISLIVFGFILGLIWCDDIREKWRRRKP